MRRADGAATLEESPVSDRGGHCKWIALSNTALGVLTGSEETADVGRAGRVGNG